MKTFGQRLRMAMDIRDMEQQELAARTGVRADVISHYVGDRHRPNIEELAKIAEALNVSADFLVGLKRGVEVL